MVKTNKVLAHIVDCRCVERSSSIPEPNPTPPNRYPTGLHDTAAKLRKTLCHAYPLSPYNQAFVCVLRIFMQEDSVYRTITFLSHVRIYVQQ